MTVVLDEFKDIDTILLLRPRRKTVLAFHCQYEGLCASYFS